MGMLIHRHRRAQIEREREQAQAKPRKRRSRSRKAETPPEPERAPESPYAELSDDDLLTAYHTTLPDGEATERDAQVDELDAVAGFADTFTDDPDPDEGDGSE